MEDIAFSKKVVTNKQLPTPTHTNKTHNASAAPTTSTPKHSGNNVDQASTDNPTLKNNFYAVLATDYAVADSGATHTYLTDRAAAKTKKRQHKQVRVALPDATILESSHH